MGYNMITHKLWDAELWLEAQTEFRFGKCTGFWHNFFYRKTTQHTSGEKKDGSYASILVCNKCNGIKSSFVMINNL
jgi:hypothetical protein